MDNERKSILVVDDTPTNIDILLDILSEKYEVSVAIDGESALESVSEMTPDLILLDIMMPGMDGYEVCSRLKQNESTSGIPVIFITAMTDINNEVRGFEVGAIDYITKPFSPPIVERRIETALKLESKTKELALLAKKLSKYLSPQVYVSIFRGDQDVKIESNRKKLTIFFSDIVNFTSTTEGMESEDLTALLNNYLDEMSNIALKHGGTIDKFIGDAILIFFGDPLTRGVQEDAIACASMAIEMRDRLAELQDTWLSYGIQNPFQVRFGITTGYCTVGNFGSKNRMDYTIIGSQVNIASRLETSAAPGQIIVSHETYAQINESINCYVNKEIHVKGISRPLQTYLVSELNTDGVDTSNIRSLMETTEFISSKMLSSEAFKIYSNKDPEFPIVVVDDNIPRGIIRRFHILNNEIPIDTLPISKALVVDKSWPIDEVIRLYKSNNEEKLNNPIIVMHQEKLVGIIKNITIIKYILNKKD
ncbi:MAG: response regulator [Spirochaetaceae bacterium]